MWVCVWSSGGEHWGTYWVMNHTGGYFKILSKKRKASMFCFGVLSNLDCCFVSVSGLYYNIKWIMLVIAYRNDTIQENMLFKGPSFMSSNVPSIPKRDYKVNTNILPFPTGDMKLDYLMTNVHSVLTLMGCWITFLTLHFRWWSIIL